MGTAYYLYTDGAYSLHTHQGAIGAAIYLDDPQTADTQSHWTGSKQLARCDHHFVAECAALEYGLHYLTRHYLMHQRTVVIRLDNLGLVNFLLHGRAIPNRFVWKSRYNHITRLLDENHTTTFEIEWVPRELNAVANQLAQQACFTQTAVA